MHTGDLARILALCSTNQEAEHQQVLRTVGVGGFSSTAGLHRPKRNKDLEVGIFQ
jgi:hypothetical protein